MTNAGTDASTSALACCQSTVRYMAVFCLHKQQSEKIHGHRKACLHDNDSDRSRPRERTGPTPDMKNAKGIQRAAGRGQ